MNVTQDDRIVTVKEAAQLLRLRTRKSLDRMRRRGTGPRYYTLGEGSKPRIRYRLGDVMAFLRPSDDRHCN